MVSSAEKVMKALCLASFVSFLGCTQGEKTMVTPPINRAPKQAVFLAANFTRLPPGAHVDSDYMIARYESHALKCSEIRPLAGGSVVSPQYEVMLSKDPDRGFKLWLDRMQPDSCGWKLTLIRYGTKQNNRKMLEALFDSDVFSSPQTFYCTWGASVNGICLKVRGMRGRLVPDDTTLTITKED